MGSIARERRAPLPGAVLYSLPDAARLLGVSLATLKRLRAAGDLRVVRVSARTVRVTRAEIERFAARLDDEARAEPESGR